MKKIKLSVASILLGGICYAQSPVVQQDDYLFIKNKDMQYISMNVESMIEWIRADIKTNSIVAGNLSMINSDTGLLN